MSEEAEKRKDHLTRWGAWEFYIKRDTKDTVPINPRDDEDNVGIRNLASAEARQDAEGYMKPVALHVACPTYGCKPRPMGISGRVRSQLHTSGSLSMPSKIHHGLGFLT